MIKTIKLDIAGTEIEVTLEQARQLYDKFVKLFGNSVEAVSIPTSQWIYPTYPSQPPVTLTFSGSYLDKSAGGYVGIGRSL